MLSVMTEPNIQLQGTQLASYRALFQDIAYAAEYGDKGVAEHVRRVAAYTGFVARHVLHWTDTEATRLEIAALVHDVGKRVIPPTLLTKPARLTHSERLIMQQHTEAGFQMMSEVEKIDAIRNVDHDPQLFTYAKQVTRFHHENWDGSGYATGLAGTGIPIAARIVKIVDVIDALLIFRPYKEAWPWNKVRREVSRLSGVEFDPSIVRGLLDKEDAFIGVYWQEVSA